MILAVAHENGQVAPHFGHTREFKLYDITLGEVRETAVVPVNESGHAGLALCLLTYRAGAVLCDQIGPEMTALLRDAGIPVFAGVSGPCDECVQKFLTGSLQYTAQPTCDRSACAGCSQGCGDADARDPLADCGCGCADDGLDRYSCLDEED